MSSCACGAVVGSTVWFYDRIPLYCLLSKKNFFSEILDQQTDRDHSGTRQDKRI